MLKSTHKSQAALPEGWTAHKAPTGHTYYYHASTKQSTYTRPEAEAEPEPPSEVRLQNNIAAVSNVPSQTDVYLNQRNAGSEHLAHHAPARRSEPKDRPKSKKPIPNAEPWQLVQTKLGRRFVYNPELNESFWKFPPDILKCVVELDRKERERRERRERGEPSDSEPEETHPNGAAPAGIGHGDESDEYEEVEVTDDEDESIPKRPRVDDEKPKGPVEFDEDDIAYQLAAMGQGDDGDDDQAEAWDAEEEEMDSREANALFEDLLDDFEISPYTPWDRIIEEGKIIEDDRYVCLPNMRSRKTAWESWSHDRIQQLKERRAHQEKKDPRVPYLAFLQQHATPKLYWPEFKRKFRKEAPMRDNKLTDKDREKLYREHINRLKIPEATLKAELTTTLKSLSLRILNRSTSLDTLPSELLTDIRYISLRPEVRDPIIEAYISIQPSAPDEDDVSPEEALAVKERREARERRETAFKEREHRVEAAKRQQNAVLRASRGALKASEDEIRRAMHVDKAGLLGHLDEEA